MLAKDSLPWDSLYVPKRCYGRVKEATSTRESNPLHLLTFWTRDNVRLFSICKGESGGREKAIKIFVVIHSFLGFLASYLHPSLFFKINFIFFCGGAGQGSVISGELWEPRTTYWFWLHREMLERVGDILQGRRTLKRDWKRRLLMSQGGITLKQLNE